MPPKNDDRYGEYRKICRDIGVDALALVPGANFTRVFDTSFHSHERPLVVIIPVEGAPAALVPDLELRSFDLLNFEGAVFGWRDQDGYSAAFDALAAHLPLATLAVEGQVMRVFVHHALQQAYDKLQVIDAEREISGLRIIKSEAELNKIQAAIEISERALSAVLAQVRVGMSEKEVEGRLIQALFAEGADDLAFGPIVAAGANSALPHAHAGAYQIQPGDALLFDFGALKHGFCADITRTVFVGEPSAEARDIYETVRAANLKGHEVTRAGITAHEIDDAVTSVLEASPHAAHIRTKTGHGLGRDVHEAPYIMRGNHQVLHAGVVFTNEPGLYKAGAFGVRIEDDVVVTTTGCRSLTSFPKDLLVVG
ncbi:MAG: M24 family metallopeptidase [Pikeienuella sp.]